MATKKDLRSRNFATVIYPESAPEDWLEILGEQKIPAFVSPFHDLDVNPTGEVKKEHYHVMVMFEGKKSVEQVMELFAQIGGVGCEQIQSIRAYARYLCHLDNPDKTQYSPENVRQFGGADYQDIIGLAADKYKCVREMLQFCRENGIVSYSDLMDYAEQYRFEWFRVLCDCGTVVVREYLKSRTWLIDYSAEQRRKAALENKDE